MPYEAKAVANYFFELAKSAAKDIDPMKMQKLAYFAHGWGLALKDAPLISERIEAWRYGPVIRELYSAFRDSGSGPITHPAYDALFRGTKFVFHAPSIDEQEEDNQIEKSIARDLISQIWNVYGGFSGIQLSNMTHQPGTPWYETWKAAGETNAVISDDLMKNYFKILAEKA